MGMSALAGLALTYYYDNPRNAKLMTILQVLMIAIRVQVFAVRCTLSHGPCLVRLTVSSCFAGLECEA